MELVSVNTSVLLNIKYGETTVSTGIFKTSVAGPVFVGSHNLDGDTQADLKNHGRKSKAVYGFSADHYSYWSKTLNRPDIKPGTFGENLTISGFEESRIHIGDDLRVGDCILQVSQPRVPCFKLGLALDNNELPRLFVKYGATGVYFRVIKEGMVKAGDTVQIIRSEPSAVSIKSLFDAYFNDRSEAAISVIEQASRVSQLSEEWKKKLPSRLHSLRQLHNRA